MMSIRELQDAIKAVTLPIVELAGPTPEGYKLLESQAIALPSRPIVTNIVEQVVLDPFGENRQEYTVDMVANVKELPFGNSSIGMLMVSALPLSDHDSRSGPYTSAIKQHITTEYDAVCAGNLGAIHHALHLHMYKEAVRVLAPGGLLLQVWPYERDSEVARQVGLTLVFEQQGADHTVLFQKSAGSVGLLTA